MFLLTQRILVTTTLNEHTWNAAEQKNSDETEYKAIEYSCGKLVKV